MKAGDLVECVSIEGLRNPKIVVGEIYTISFLEGDYIYIHIKDVSEPGGGYFPKRFVPLHTVLDASEYDDIIAGQEIYEELK